MTNADDSSERVLVLMPTVKDGERTTVGLGQASISCFVCADLAQLCREYVE